MDLDLRIIDLTSTRTDLVDAAAATLHEAFRERSAHWQNIASARHEVIESLADERISRVAIATTGELVGWIGAIPAYGGHVWEIHPLVVAGGHQRQGIGRALLADLEEIVAARGGLTLWAGSDDEHFETSLGGADLYEDLPAAIRGIQNLAQHPFQFYLNCGFTIAGVVPDANGVGKPDILLAKRIRNTGD